MSHLRWPLGLGLQAALTVLLLRPPEAEESLDRRGPRAGAVCLPVGAVDTLSAWAPGMHEPTGRVCEYTVNFCSFVINFKFRKPEIFSLFFQDFYVSWSPLRFHVNVKMNFSTSVKNIIGILTDILLNL